MLTCREVTERASAYVDRELPLRSRLAMRLHLAMCVHCRRYFRQFRQLLAALAVRVRIAKQPADPAQVERLLAKLPWPAQDDRGPPPAG